MTQLPSPTRLPVPQHTKRLRPKTYSVAVYLVIGVVVLQVVMVISIFWLRAIVVPVSVQFPKASFKTEGLSPLPSESLPSILSPATPPAPDKLPPSLALNLNQPARLNVPTDTDPNEQINSLNEQAHMLMNQNDFRSGLDLLIKAEDIDPRHPTTLENLAQAYYLMNNSVRAKQYWQRLIDLGPNAGPVYGHAKDHVMLLGDTDTNPLKEPSGWSRFVYIEQVEKTPVETLNGQPQFHLRTVLRQKDPNVPEFDQKRLRPYVIFYQQMSDGKLVPDLGQHGGAFEDTFLFWNKKPREAFGVDYVMPVPGLSGPNNTVTGKYYGFVIGIYYDNQLQDARSEPSDLITRLPLPVEIE